MTAPDVIIYHNPRCSTSRDVLQMLIDAGHPPDVVDYLQTGWTGAGLRALMKAARVDARGLLRAKEPLARDLGLLEDGATDADILAAMVKHPILVERPIVRTGKGAVVARPKDRIFEIL